MTRAVLIDDHQLFRCGLRQLVKDHLGFTEVHDAVDLDSGLQLLFDLAGAELIIVDLNMPGSSGPESITALVEAFPEARIVVMSASEDTDDIMGSLATGVDGYVPKSLSVPEIVSALNQVMSGAVFVPRALARRGVERTAQPLKRPLVGVEHLTTRQREVLDQLLLGKASKEIARALDVAEGTVKIHLAAIYRALGVKSRAEAISRLMARA